MLFSPPSFWETDTFLQPTDLLIIGSGIVGLSAAISAKEKDKNLRVTIIERGSLPAGASTRNAGFACFGSLSELLSDLETHTEDQLFALVERRFRGLERLRRRVGDVAIDYLEYGGYEVFMPEEQAIFEKCQDKIAYFNAQLAPILGIKNIYAVADTKIADFGFRGVSHLIHNHAEGQIHTGKMMHALLQKAQALDIQLLNGLEIAGWEEFNDEIIVKTLTGASLHTQQLLVCTNGFAKRLLPNLAVVPARNQVLITEPIANLPLQGCFHYDSGYYYFRNVGHRVLLGGGRNMDKTGEETDIFGTTALIQNRLLDLLHTIILPQQPTIKVAQWWSGIMGIGEQKRPIVERVSSRITVAVRMGGMGVAIGSLVGEEGANLALGA